MKAIVVTIYLLMGVIMLVAAFYRMKSRTEHYKPVATLLFLAALANFTQAGFLASDVFAIAQALSCLYSITIVWVIFFATIFMERYTNRYKEVNGVRLCYHILATLDTLMLAVNMWVPFMFKVGAVDTKWGRFYIHTERTVAFYIHGVICASLVLIPALALISISILTCRSFYRRKYIYVALAAVITIAVSVESAFVSRPINITSLVFGIMVLTAVYMEGYLFPRMLREQTAVMSIQQMTDVACILDIDKNLVFINENGKRHVSEESLAVVLEDAKAMADMDINKDKDHFTWLDKVMIRFDVGDAEFEAPYQMRFRRLKRKKEIIGYYLVMHNRTEEIENFKRDHYKLTHDEMTGLYNREYFFEKCRRMLEKNPNDTYYLVLSDIDNFKLFNELYGTEKGDAVLMAEAELLRSLCSEATIYGRMGGDKFAIMVPEDRFYPDLLVNCITKLRDDFSENSFKVVIRGGVYRITDHSEMLMSIYNKALLAISSLGNNYASVLSYFTPEMLDKILNERWLLDELQNALERDEFEMYLQPQVHAEDGRWLGAEALVRWINSERGMISPGEFIPLFERMGVMGKVDEVIWEKAAAKIKEWNQMGRNDLYISVNISGNDFYHFDLYAAFTSLVERYEISPKQLKLEVTESFMVEDGVHRKEVLEKLRQYGFIIEIDDFGSGYSALNSLKDIPCDVIKVDMGFLRKSENPELSNIILEAVLQLIKRLDKEIITEGVETKEQVEYLKAHDCDVIQGFHFSRPVPVGDFEAHVL